MYNNCLHCIGTWNVATAAQRVVAMEVLHMDVNVCKSEGHTLVSTNVISFGIVGDAGTSLFISSNLLFSE
jgi:hypothetical protein